MRILGSLMVLSLVTVGGLPAEAAKKKPGGGDSETACVNWCFDHNTTTVSRDKCLNQCECYYHGQLCVKPGGGSAAGAGGAAHPMGKN